MKRQWTTLAIMLTTVMLTISGLAVADDESPIGKLMEKVGQKANMIKKAVRTQVAYKKSQKELSGLADELIKLAKDSKDMKEPAEKQKKTYEEWVKLSDEWIKKTEEFRDLVAKPSTDQAVAKKAFNSVNTTCTECHKVFRVDDVD